jgi:hypothetical protein
VNLHPHLRNSAQTCINKNAQLDATSWLLPGIIQPLHYQLPNQKNNLPARFIKTPRHKLEAFGRKTSTVKHNSTVFDYNLPHRKSIYQKQVMGHK